MPAFLIDKQMVVWYTKSSEKVVLLFDANMQIAKNSIGFESAEVNHGFKKDQSNLRYRENNCGRI